MHIIVLELQKLSKVIEKPINEMSKQDLWGLFFKCIPDKSRRELMNEISKREEGIAMACALLKTMSQDEHTRARLEAEFKNELDYQNGMAEARMDGWNDGIIEGEMKGRMEGKMDMAVQIARSLLGLGMSVVNVSKSTGLTESEILRLQ